MHHQDTVYDLVNSLTGCCTYWTGLLQRDPFSVLTYVDPWHERKEAHLDLYRYLTYIDEECFE